MAFITVILPFFAVSVVFTTAVIAGTVAKLHSNESLNGQKPIQMSSCLILSKFYIFNGV